MPRVGHNEMPALAKKRYAGRRGRDLRVAAGVTGGPASPGSNWFLEAGGMLVLTRRRLPWFPSPRMTGSHLPAETALGSLKT